MRVLEEERFARARCALEGLSVGDAFGEQYFMSWNMIRSVLRSEDRPGPPYDFTDDEFMARLIHKRRLPEPDVWPFTDDTQMALSVVENLRRFGEIRQDELAHSVSMNYDNGRAYGAGMHSLLPRLAHEPWQKAATSLFDGQGSFGNGAAMRVAPIGAYFADDLGAVAENARRSAEVTHAHPEAICGAIAVGVAAACAWRLRGSSSIDGRAYINEILAFVPESEVRDGIKFARGMLEDSTLQEAVGVLGNGEQVSAQDTVPFCLWCAAQHLNRFDEALWLTVSGLGDRDTTCAIVGGIVVMCAGAGSIPELWRESREPLPTWPFSAE
jgi:ADP-ribosylglycohydrolase